MLFFLNNINSYKIIINSKYLINIILAFSNLLGIKSVYILYKKNKKYLSILTFNLISVSFFHHLIETNEMNHNLDGVYIPIISNYGKQIRFMDISLAILLVLNIVYTIKTYVLINYIIKNKFIFFSSILCSYCCDFIIVKKPFTYLLFHFYWHVFILYFLNKLCIDII